MRMKIDAGYDFEGTADKGEIIDLRRSVFALLSFVEALGYSMSELPNGSYEFKKMPIAEIPAMIHRERI